MTGTNLILGKPEQTWKKIKEITTIELEKPTPDVLIIHKEPDKKNIGIEASRQIIKFLSTNPYAGKTKTIIIKDAHTLSHQAQNALLKTLEEPPAFAEIYLLAKDEDALLETVVSRCKRIKTAPEFQSPSSVLFVKMNLGERLELAEELSKLDKQEILNYLEGQVLGLREDILHAGFVEVIEGINLVIKDLSELNINTRLALERLFLGATK